jgi:hypothetical protein
MSEENENIKITEKDLSFLENEFLKTSKPLSIQEMTRKLVYQKSSHQLSQEVKKYDPECVYEVGDYIYKEYDEPLLVSSKGVEPFKGAVVLRVTKKIPYKAYKCEMLEIDYTGGGIFRKYMDYMKKTKTQVLLPSNYEAKGKALEIMEKNEDPRLSELPMTDRDLKTLERNLRTALNKSPKFFNWDEFWQLEEKKIEVEEKKIEEIESHLTETKSSAATAELVTKFFNMESSNELFDLFCMSFNFVLEKEYKKDFIYISPIGWGKWHLKEIINSLPQDLPLSAPMAELPAAAEETKYLPIQTQDFPLKIYLTWREILSGGVKVPKSLHRELSNSREYTFTDTEEGKDYTVYYYPSSGFFLGLKNFYEQHNVPQGASLTFEKRDPNHLNFWLKKSKKKLAAMKMTYDPKEDRFALSSEEAFTYSLPNKIIHMEREILNKLLFYYQQRDTLDLRGLLILIFKNFGAESENFSLHYLRAYHLVDILKQTTQEDVERTLLGCPEFFQSEKKKGIFFYREKVKIKEELKVEEILPEAPPEGRIEEVPSTPPSFVETREEAFPTEARNEIQIVTPLEPIEVERKEKERPPKAKRKKKQMIEGEREIRARKGVKRIIEEKIELEESEQEAHIAVKAKEKKEGEEEKEEVSAKKEKAEYKSLEPKEPAFGLFGEKLKTALDKTKKKK